MVVEVEEVLLLRGWSAASIPAALIWLHLLLLLLLLLAWTSVLPSCQPDFFMFGFSIFFPRGRGSQSQ
jgi:hypothetical protein